MYGSLKVIIMVIQKNIQSLIVESDSQLGINFVNDRIFISKYIVNLVDDVRVLSSFFRDISIEYYNRQVNRDVDRMPRKRISVSF